MAWREEMGKAGRLLPGEKLRDDGCFFFSSRRRHTRFDCDWSSDVCSSDLLTPYPDTALYERIKSAERLLHSDWDLYDTRHVVFKPARLTPAELEAGYWSAYREDRKSVV